MLKTLGTVITALSFAALATAENSEFPLLEGPYMGQTPPGLVAEPFAPGIISRELSLSLWGKANTNISHLVLSFICILNHNSNEAN